MTEAVQVALIVALAPIGATVITWLLNLRKLKEQDVVLQGQTEVIEQVHTAVNSNYTALGNRLDGALKLVERQAVIMEELKGEIARINATGIVTPGSGKRRGDVTMSQGKVETRTERDSDHMAGQSHADKLQEQHAKKPKGKP